MRKLAIFALLFGMMLAGVASGATMFKSSGTSAEDFCFGYAICE